MAVRDVLNYYNQVTKDYFNMQVELKDMEELLADKMVSPEMVDQMKRMISPIKSNYETLSYFMFLLNQPVKKCKQSRYKSQNKGLLNHSKSKEEVLSENAQALQELRDMRGTLKDDH